MARTRGETSRKRKHSEGQQSCHQASSSSSSSCSTAAPSDPVLPTKAGEVVTLRLTPRSHIMEQLLRLADINFKLQLRMPPQTTLKSIVDRVLGRWRSHVGNGHRVVAQGLRLHLPPTVDAGEVILPVSWSIQDVVKVYPHCVDGGVTWLVFDGEDDKCHEAAEPSPLPAPSSPIDTTESCIRGIMESNSDAAVIAAAQAVENIPDFRSIGYPMVPPPSAGTSAQSSSPTPRRNAKQDVVDGGLEPDDMSRADGCRETSGCGPRKKAKVERAEASSSSDSGRGDTDTIATALQMSHQTHMALLAFQERQQEMLERQQAQFAKMLEQQQDWMKSLHGTMLQTLQIAFKSTGNQQAEPKGG
ncbi:hypothetical protein FOL47_005416 [Perkinsus chesapeaki]|uniref:Uncharacterized protein n=1 Tax=Perkinsus chesapeaki TaxID=330153 RepID=A0A7J6N3J1_PERCH|nr:hypothetical protein FOL47_005416 [Perkinsus chesapeaki]